MARRDLPFCVTCGAPACTHPRDPQVTWQPPPWSDGLLDFLGMAAFTLAFAGVLMGVGPLLWWLAYGWPPRGWIEIFGVIAIALVSIPGWVVGLGLLVSLPEHWQGRCWRICDARGDPDDVIAGFLFMRLGRPVCGDVTRTVRSALPSHDRSDMSSITAAGHTGGPALVLAAALAGLTARGQLALTLVETTGWTRDPNDAGPRPKGALAVHARRLSPRTSDTPWIEGTLLDLLAPDLDLDLHHPLRDLVRAVMLEIGYTDPDGDGPTWPADAPGTPAEALRALLLGASPATPDDPEPIAAALATWRARDPARVGPVLDLLAHVTAELVSPPNAEELDVS